MRWAVVRIENCCNHFEAVESVWERRADAEAAAERHLEGIPNPAGHPFSWIVAEVAPTDGEETS